MNLPLLPVQIDPEAFRSRRLRIEPVSGDAMEPTLRQGDFVLCIPAHQYVSEGLYVLASGDDASGIYRCSRILGSDRIRLSRDNPAYPEQHVPVSRFNYAVLAVVVADIKVRDEYLLRDAIAGGRP